MNELVIKQVTSMTKQEIETANKAEDFLLSLDQSKLKTWHTLHAGVYTRTVIMQPGESMVGALIKIPTILSIYGSLKLYIGGKVDYVDGHTTFVAEAYRKQILTAIKTSYVTMSFATNALTIEEAEAEFTDDHDKLMSRHKDSINIITIKEDIQCQEQ